MLVFKLRRGAREDVYFNTGKGHLTISSRQKSSFKIIFSGYNEVFFNNLKSLMRACRF